MQRKSLRLVILLFSFFISVSIAGKALAVSDIDQALMEAVEAGNVMTVADLTARGAHVNAKDDLGNTPLHFASQTDVAELLIKAGAAVNAVDDDFQMTPLFNVPTDVAALLIKNGADVNWRAKKGTTPLMWTVYWNQKEKMELLIANGAKVNAGDDDGKSPLHVAANWDHVDLVNILIKKGADINIKDNECWTPLHWAAFEASITTMERLLSSGADPNAMSCPGNNHPTMVETPLDIAKRFRSADIVSYLKSRGCKSSDQR